MDGGFELTLKVEMLIFFYWNRILPRILDMAEAHGHIPLPPYIQTGDTAQDRERYQTVFAKNAGAVAAPTAGLHLDESLILKLNVKVLRGVRLLCMWVRGPLTRSGLMILMSTKCTVSGTTFRMM